MKPLREVVARGGEGAQFARRVLSWWQEESAQLEA